MNRVLNEAASDLHEPRLLQVWRSASPAQDGAIHSLPRRAQFQVHATNRSPGFPQPNYRVRRRQPVPPPTPTSRRRRSPSVSTAMIKYYPGGDTDLRGPLSFAHLLQPALHRRPRGHAFKFCAQVLLHGLALQGRAAGKLVADSPGHISNGELNCHACIMQALQALCKRGSKLMSIRPTAAHRVPALLP